MTISYIEAVKTYGSIREAARRLKIPKSTFHSNLLREKTKEEIKTNKYDQVIDLLGGISDPPMRLSSIKKIFDPTDNIIPVFLFSDWHIGETIDPEQVFGYNAFNEKISEDRVKTLISNGIGLARHESNSRKAILWLGGDFVSGYLHEEHLMTDWFTPLQAVHWATERLYNAILDLMGEFPELEIICSPGNHGRLTKRPVAKNNAFTAYDWLIFSQLKSWLGNRDGLTFSIPSEGDCLIDVNSHKTFFTHGNNIGANGGNGEIGVLGPIMRGRSRISNSLSSMGMKFDTMVLGHFHQTIWMPGKGVIVNPCLCGYNEYAKMNRWAAEPPAQLLFFLHKKFGPVIPIEIYL